jgi:hypothetical protein
MKLILYYKESDYSFKDSPHFQALIDCNTITSNKGWVNYIITFKR